MCFGHCNFLSKNMIFDEQEKITPEDIVDEEAELEEDEPTKHTDDIA